MTSNDPYMTFDPITDGVTCAQTPRHHWTQVSLKSIKACAYSIPKHRVNNVNHTHTARHTHTHACKCMQTRTLYSDSLLTIQPRTHTTTLIRHTVDTQTHITTWCYPRGDIPYTPNRGHGLNSVFAWCSSWCTYLEIVVGPRLGECPRFDGVLTHLGPRLEAFTDPLNIVQLKSNWLILCVFIFCIFQLKSVPMLVKRSHKKM